MTETVTELDQQSQCPQCLYLSHPQVIHDIMCVFTAGKSISQSSEVLIYWSASHAYTCTRLHASTYAHTHTHAHLYHGQWYLSCIQCWLKRQQLDVLTAPAWPVFWVTVSSTLCKERWTLEKARPTLLPHTLCRCLWCGGVESLRGRVYFKAS